MEYKLTRKLDNLVKEASNIKWIEWDNLGRFKQWFDEPKVGRSLILDPVNSPLTMSFTWQTDEIIDITESTPSKIVFTTKNSIYTLEINN